jgi:hypothetical protein
MIPLRLMIRPRSVVDQSMVNECKSSLKPILLPRKHFCDKLPAIDQWFKKNNEGRSSIRTSLFTSIEQLHQYSGNFEVKQGKQFHRFAAPLSDMLTRPIGEAPETSIYLTQTPLSSLPLAMLSSLNVPAIQSMIPVDLVNSSIWVCFSGKPLTPLHRDPYSNLFVQLAGRKRIRLLHPDNGLLVWTHVRQKLGADTSSQGRMRGEEMMVGEEANIMNEIVWQDVEATGEGLEGWEAELEEGDAVFIPSKWWHTLKGSSDGVNGSVSYED